MEWLLLTDTDEFLSYNYILPGENISHFDKDSIFQGRRAPSVQKRATDRVKASLTFSEQGRGSPNNTILSFIETQRSKHEVYFPIRMYEDRTKEGSFTSRSDAKNTDQNNHITKRYQYHSKILNDSKRECLGTHGHYSQSFPKAMWVEWETLVWSRLYELRAEASTSWLERGFGKGTILNKQGINEWRQKDLKKVPLTVMIMIQKWVLCMKSLRLKWGKEELKSCYCNLCKGGSNM
ncbi:LOW QUALITY PROTEIN: hypothetical protein ACHAWO_010672 [Cyclotella atomus]|uniref:Glycosyltransferase family 92 protein n=1 Tax=Cyclotella atomus TaxID=382360 RepID=A0ABD3PSM7_9STRA